MTGTLWLILGICIAGVALVIAAEIDRHRKSGKYLDGTPISYPELDRMLTAFERERYQRYGIPPDNDDEHKRIRDEIRQHRPRPWLTAGIGLVIILLLVVLIGGLAVVNTDPMIAASANQFTLPEWTVWAGLGLSLIVGLLIGIVGQAIGMNAAHTILWCIALAAAFYVMTQPGMMGDGIVAVFSSAVAAAMAVMAGAMVPATIILAVFR